MDEDTPPKPDGFDPLQVHLPVFDGPLDLLLHLVRKQSLDIQEVRLADLTEPYLVYMSRLEEMNLDQAGEFLHIAATLVWIKSKSLLPRDFTQEEPDPETLEEMLLLRLEEYQKIKDAAHVLNGKEQLGREIFPRQAPPDDEEKDTSAPDDLHDISLFNLLEAFQEVLTRTQTEPTLHVETEEKNVEDRIGEVMDILAERGSLQFFDLFPPKPDRLEVILTFLAVLEMVRLGALRIIQANQEGAILCQISDHFLENKEDWKALILNRLAPQTDPESSENLV